MTVKKARRWRDGLAFAGIAVMLLGTSYEPLFILGAVLTLSCLIPHFLFNKCPHCGRQLGRNEGEFCQFCGERLDG